VIARPGARVLCVAQGALLLLRWRDPVDGFEVWEPPGGGLEAGESLEQAARRELREEAGLEADDWTHLASTWSSPGISAELMHFFLARGVRRVDDVDFERTHEEAEMAGGWVPVDDLVAAVLDGRLGDGPLVQAVLLAHAKGLLA
jgi:8-oxo-dGTP pyrophosphatase MutT (NUDIX family)